MKTNWIVPRLETLLIFTLGLGIFVSKPVIYASSGALVAIAVLRVCFDSSYRKSLFSSRLTLASIGLFVLGLVATAVHPGTLSEIGWIARKSIYILLLPVLYLAFHSQGNRTAGLAGAFIGFWVAAILTMQSIDWQWAGGRIAGATWLVDVWGVLTGLFASFLLPRVFQAKQPLILWLLTAITLLASVGMMIMSGGRGPWLGFFAGGLIYLLFYQRKTLLIMTVLLIALYFPVKQFAPTPVAYLEDRVMSIVKTSDDANNPETYDAGNWVRMSLWKTSLAQDLHKLHNTPMTFLFGSGPNNQIHEMRAFFMEWNGMSQTDKERLMSYDYPGNEVHNMYLDAMGKMGILWTLSAVLLMLAVIIKSLQIRQRDNQASLAVLVVTVNFMVTGIFYDLLPHWGTFFLVFFTMLAMHGGQPHKSQSAGFK